jgi:glutathione S-transferase
MKLHYNIVSPYSQKVLIAFYEKGVDFTPAIISLSNKEESLAYKKLYPLGKIPLLTGDNELFVPESSIIIEYLENEFSGQGTQLIPREKTAARRTHLRERMVDLYVTDQILTLYFDSTKPQDQQNPQAVAKAHDTLSILFTSMDKDFASFTYAASNDFSIVDCALFGPLFYAQQLHPFKEYANITAYFSRLMQRDSVKKVLTELMPALHAMQQK